jgi:hypothetical protein
MVGGILFFCLGQDFLIFFLRKGGGGVDSKHIKFDLYMRMRQIFFFFFGFSVCFDDWGTK